MTMAKRLVVNRKMKIWAGVAVFASGMAFASFVCAGPEAEAPPTKFFRIVDETRYVDNDSEPCPPIVDPGRNPEDVRASAECREARKKAR